jgi:hypothetical protein
VSITDFICEWSARLSSALAAGCEYSDAVLAFKLLDSSHLTADEIQQGNFIGTGLTVPTLNGPGCLVLALYLPVVKKDTAPYDVKFCRKIEYHIKYR